MHDEFHTIHCARSFSAPEKQRCTSLHTVLSAVLLLLALDLEGCTHEQKKTKAIDALVFDSVDSLLSERIADSVLSISYRPPKGWDRLSRTLLDSAVKLGAPEHGAVHASGIMAAFVDRRSGSAFVTARVDSFDMSDSSVSVKNICEYIRNQDSTADVRSAVFRWGPFRVHQIMAIARTRVSLKMIFDLMEERAPMFEWDFDTPRDLYSDKAKTIESVVGSLQIHRTVH